MKLSTLGIAKLSMLFRNISYLPALPTEVMGLVKEIDDPASTIDRVAKFVASDEPILNDLRKLCIAHQIEPDEEGTLWLRAAIYLLGANAVRRFVIASLIQRAVSVKVPGCLFDPAESISRSQRYGLMTECVFSNPDSLCVTDLPEPGSFYVAEILHELPRALLALQAPGTYNRVALSAQANEASFETAFEDLFECKIAKLGEFAIQGWGLMGAIGASLIVESASIPLAA